MTISTNLVLQHMKTIARSPNQYSNFKTSTDIKPIDKYKGLVVIFDNMLGARNSSQIDVISTKSRHENFSVFYSNQSFFLVYLNKPSEITVIE